MGIHDYSCLLCSDEGEQCIIDWEEYYEEEDDEEEQDSEGDEKMLIYPPPDGTSNGLGAAEAHLFFFKQNPLITLESPYKYRKAEYKWDNWGFDKYDGYDKVLLNETNDPNAIYSVWQSNKAWIVNICPACYKFFISDELSDPCSTLLVKVLDKFKLYPFSNFEPRRLDSIIVTDNNINLKPFLPLNCTKIRDYIRAFCSYLNLRVNPINFTFENLANNNLVKILEKGKLGSDKYDPNRPGPTLDGLIMTPLEMAIKNENIEQIEHLVKKGAHVDEDKLHQFLMNTKYKHIVLNNYELFDREDVAHIILNNKRLWKLISESFFDLTDFQVAFSSLSNNQDDTLIKYLIEIFPNKYTKIKYYDYVCKKDLLFMKKIFKLGFSPQTHFDHVINLSWVEGTKLCLKYGAKLDDAAKYHLKRHNNSEIKKLVL